MRAYLFDPKKKRKGRASLKTDNGRRTLTPFLPFSVADNYLTYAIMKKTLISMKGSQPETFQGSGLQTAMMQAITGGNIYPGSTAGSSQTKLTYDSQGRQTGCQVRYDTQVVDKNTLKYSEIWGDWEACK